MLGNRRGDLSLKGDHEFAVWTRRQTFQAQTQHEEDMWHERTVFPGSSKDSREPKNMTYVEKTG